MSARILLVDDDPDYLTVTRDLLERGGHVVLVASTFEEGRRVLREDSPDLLIADVRLGAFNGLQLVATDRGRIPSIIVSGFDDAVLQAEAAGFGAEYLVKPVAAAALLGLISQKLAAQASLTGTA